MQLILKKKKKESEIISNTETDYYIVGNRSRGRLEGSLFNSYYTEV